MTEPTAKLTNRLIMATHGICISFASTQCVTESATYVLPCLHEQTLSLCISYTLFLMLIYKYIYLEVIP